MPISKRTFLSPIWAGFLGGILVACSLFGPDPAPPADRSPAANPPDAALPPTSTPTPLPPPTPLPAARLEQADYALFIGDWEAARQAYTLALQNQPEPELEAAALLGLARVQSAVGEEARALDTLRTLADQHPDLPATYYFLGQVYSRLQRYAEAAQALERYIALRPGVIDAYAQEWLGDARFAAGDYAGAVEAFAAAAAAPRVGPGEPIRIKLGQAYTFLGDLPAALAIYDEIYASTGNDFYRAQVNYLRGDIYTALGQPEAAYQLYRESAARFPFAIHSYLGMVRLVEAGAALNEFDRGLVDYYAGEYSLAVAAFDRFLADETVAHDGAAHHFKALSLRGFNEAEAAIREWEELIATHPFEDPYWASAWEEKGYTQWAYLGDYEGALQTFLGFVDTVPAHPRAGDFLFYAGQVAERDGQLPRAAEIWRRLAAEYPQHTLATRAVFLAGLADYRLGNFSSALPEFQRALELTAAPEERAAAALWLGKARTALGLHDEARLAWQQAASFDPTGYYSERALELLDGRAPFSPPGMVDFAVDLDAERREAEAWLRSVFPLAANANLAGLGVLPDDPRFVRGTELWQLGLYEAARAEFEDLRLSIRDDPIANYQLANYLLELGLYRTAIFCARQVLNLAGLDDAATLGAPVWFNHVRFGLYYRDLVLANAQARGVHPLLVWSLIRQESLFEGFIRSSAGARGLAQIMPATGQGIHQNLGWPEGYTSDDLYRPVISVAFGVDYLADQLALFDGDVYAALAAYNGGPGNARIWYDLAQGDPDLFLEIIRFEETRNYVRGVYEIFSIYRRIYDRTP